MNVLILIRSQHPSLSGADNMAMLTAKWLVRSEGIAVTLARASVTVREPIEAVEDGVRTMTLPACGTSWGERLSAIPFELIHLFDLSDRAFLQLAVTLVRHSGVPLVLTPATDRSFWECEQTAILACRAASHIFVLTATEERLIRTLSGIPRERISRIPNAPCLPESAVVLSGKKAECFRIKHRIPLDAPLVLFLGRKLVSKGYPLMLEAAQEVWKEDPRVHFALIGPRTAESKAALARFGQERRILDLPLVPESEKAGALAACDLFCLPSVADVFPLVFLEAWACEKPVIASRMAGAADVVREGIDGLIVEAHRAAVAQAITTLLADEPLRRRMGASGKQRVDRDYSWERISGMVAAVYKQLDGC
ncbi:MAG: glycosyltransferase family 4 protein [Brevibacillus sp.]|nr:glycosyltransferase family 4 protein [Brevibacillus sp.]